MVKFFLKNEKALPKKQLEELKKEKKSPKVVDFRIVVYKKLFNLIKAQHAIITQKVIRQIKEKKAQPQTERISQQIGKLDEEFQHLKALKKDFMKKITLYFMANDLKINNLAKVSEKEKGLDLADIQVSTINSEILSSNQVCEFLKKLSNISTFKKELQECAGLVQVVNNKKILRKEKMKERKSRKKERQLLEKSEKGNEKINEQSSHEFTSEEQQSEKALEQLSANRIQSKSSDKVQQQITTKQSQNARKVNPFFQRQNEKAKQKLLENRLSEQKHSQQKESLHKEKSYREMSKKERLKKDIEKAKPIHKERTQFKKTGRNKVIHEKKQQREKFYPSKQSKEMSQTPKHSNYSFNKEQSFSAKPINSTKSTTSHSSEAPKKINGHPSWVAKQQLKAQVYIKPFQGKKILL